MIKRKSFFYNLDKQEKWLNSMAAEGYRLVGTKGTRYDFEECAPYEYEYRIDFASGRKGYDLQQYEDMLSELGYDVYRRSISFGQKSYGKYRLNLASGEFENRSTNSTHSQVQSIFIIGRKKMEKPFEIYTDSRDLREYYSKIATSYLVAAILVFTIVFFGSTRLGFIIDEAVRLIISLTVKVIAAGAGIALFRMFVVAQRKVWKMMK